MKPATILLTGLATVLAYLTLTQQGKEFARKIGNTIMDIPQYGIDLIKDIEKFSAKAYRDAGGFSIGYGHFIKPGENFTTLSEQQASALLAADTANAAAVIKRYVTVPLNVNQTSALLSFVYNVGEGQFRTSTLLKKLNAGDYAGAANQFAVWNKTHSGGVLVVSPALIARRVTEKSTFLA